MITSLTDRLDALDNLIQAHIAATEKLLPGSAYSTAKHADELANLLREDGRPQAANHLQGLADLIRFVGNFPANE